MTNITRPDRRDISLANENVNCALRDVILLRLPRDIGRGRSNFVAIMREHTRVRRVLRGRELLRAVPPGVHAHTDSHTHQHTRGGREGGDEKGAPRPRRRLRNARNGIPRSQLRSHPDLTRPYSGLVVIACCLFAGNIPRARARAYTTARHSLRADGKRCAFDASLSAR